MRLSLDDNERGALNYLFGGVIIVLLLRGAGWALGAVGPATTPDGLVLTPFQHGYWGMHNRLAVADAASTWSERLVLAVVWSVGTSFLISILLRALPGAHGPHLVKARRWATRGLLLASLCWTLYAACLLPLKEARVVNGKMVTWERTRLIGDLPLPFGTKETHYSRADVALLTVQEHAPIQGCNGSVVLLMLQAGNGQALPFAELGGICPEGRMENLRAGSEAAALLERELR